MCREKQKEMLVQEAREDTSDRERQRKRKRERDYKSSRLPHHILYPPLVSHSPHPPNPLSSLVPHSQCISMATRQGA